MPDTALASALKSAGVNTDAALVRGIAEDELRKVARNPRLALAAFVAELRDAGGLIAQVVSEISLQRDSLFYLEMVARDMLGKHLKVPAKAGDGVQMTFESHHINGPVESSEGEGSNPVVTSQMKSGHSPSDSVPSRGGGGVQVSIASQSGYGSLESREGEVVHEAFGSYTDVGPSSSLALRNGVVPAYADSHSRSGRVVPIPNKPRTLADRIEINKILSNSYFDSVKLSDGTVFANTPFGTIRRQYNGSVFDQLLRQSVLNYVQVSDDAVIPRDVIPPKVYESMVNEAREKARANAI